MIYSVVLHNIRSAHNVGSIFRTADAAGFSHVYLSGCTPTPTDRFGRERSDIAKVALGAQQEVEWQHFASLDEALVSLDTQDRTIVALEQYTRSIPYMEFKGDSKVKETIVLLGEETKGIEEEYLKRIDTILEIPMHGSKESLNVSVAFGILAYQLINPNR
jgi:tRNA G18 (ribose-2'-O)-methylase SpoU